MQLQGVNRRKVEEKIGKRWLEKERVEVEVGRESIVRSRIGGEGLRLAGILDGRGEENC